MPSGHRAIGLKWVFKLKRNEEGEVVKHRAWWRRAMSRSKSRLRRGIRTGGKVGICPPVAGNRGTVLLGDPPHGREVRFP